MLLQVKTKTDDFWSSSFYFYQRYQFFNSNFFYSDCEKVAPAPKAENVEEAEKLWDLSVKMVQLGDWDPFTAPNDVLPPLLQNI